MFGLLAFMKTKFDSTEEKGKPKYQYKRKDFLITRAEHKFYDVLISAVGHEYYVFAQVYLPLIVYPNVPKWSYRAARAHINRRSVDYVLCDKNYIRPRLAIELDDKSHEREDRMERDIEVERIFREAGMPLLRIENHGNFDAVKIAEQIKNAIK
jgi:hypothetical protein